jgi:hypothetical protein
MPFFSETLRPQWIAVHQLQFMPEYLQERSTKKSVLQPTTEQLLQNLYLNLINPCAPPLYSSSFRSPIMLTQAGLAFPVFPVIADFDMDGKPDVATVSKSVIQ